MHLFIQTYKILFSIVIQFYQSQTSFTNNQRMSLAQSPVKISDNEQLSSYSMHSENVFTAVKQLKQKELHLINLANRIKKLELKQMKNLQKCQNDHKLLESLQKIRDQRQRQLQKYNQYKSIVRNQVEEQHIKNTREKSMKKQTIKSVFNDIKNKRMSNYEFMKNKRQQNQKKVIKIKELELNQKKNMRNKVVDQQKSMKQSRMYKMKNKKQNIEHTNQKQIVEIKQKSKKQQMEIQKLARLQLELLNKNSQSQVRSNDIRQRYQKFIKDQKLSLSALRKKQNEQNLYIHPLVKRIQKRMDKYNFQNAR